MTRLEKALKLCQNPEVLTKFLTENLCPGDILPNAPDGKMGNCPGNCVTCWYWPIEEEEK